MEEFQNQSSQRLLVGQTDTEAQVAFYKKRMHTLLLVF